MSPQQSWDYKSVLVNTKGLWSRGVIDVSTLDGTLAEFGTAGWELVAIVPVSDGNVGTARLLCTFKRPAASTAT
jgi:hypothetical protein